VDHAPRLQPGEGLASDHWAQQEFGGANLGDKRRTARLVHSAALLAEHPGRAINASAQADSSAVNGFYRLIHQPKDSSVTPERILEPHRERTIQRMRAQKEVLCLQDGSDLRFATRPGCTGLEVIGQNQTSAKTRGLHMHLTLAVTPEGLPLGVLRCGFGTPSQRAGGKTQRWIAGCRDTVAAARSLTQRTKLVAVMDREADFHALFDERRQVGRVDIPVRARHDRRLGRKGPKLFPLMSEGQAKGCMEVEIGGLVARPKTSRKKARPARRRRLANCELRFRTVTLPPTAKGREPVSLQAVHVVERDPPRREPAVQWHLLTSLAVDSAEDAERVVGHYLQRWRIEDFFRVLKSGCRAECLAFRSADRLQRAIVIKSVIAWRIMLLTLLGRQVPHCEAELMFTGHELEFLQDYARKCRLPGPGDLGAAVRLVARLGGYRDRRHDPEPGHQIMWHGYDTLTKATLGHKIAIERAQEDSET